MPDPATVSCLMVTLPSKQRAPYVRRAIAAYCAQTYPAKELLILQDADGSPTAAHLGTYIESLRRTDIRLVETTPGQTLGALRNLSRTLAGGEILCQWDDDDLFHPEKLERQVAALVETGAEAVGLQDVLQYFPATRELYWTNWRMTPSRVHPGTLVFWAKAPVCYPETGDGARRGEDSDVCAQFLARNALGSLTDAPHLNIYVSHGVNTWDDSHHAMLARTLGVSHALLRRREAGLSEMLAALDFGPGPIDMRGPNGVAFTLQR